MMNRRNFIGLSAAAASLSGERGFGEAVGEKPLLSFGLITDVQYADAEPHGERHYRASVPKLEAAVNWLAKRKFPFTLHLGDLIDREFTAFATVLPVLEKLGHPVRHLLGNHDYSVTDSEKAGIAATLQMPQDYYPFSSSGVRFVMLDTNEVSTYKYPGGSPQAVESSAVMQRMAAERATNAQPWNGGPSVTQLEWLDRELAAAETAAERVILCGHHPLLPADNYQAWSADGVLAVIDRHPSVAAYFSGHNHAGAEVVRNGIPYITFKSILHEPDVNAWAAIHVFADRLEIEGNGREKSRGFPLVKAG